jgi:hypothetical protein
MHVGLATKSSGRAANCQPAKKLVGQAAYFYFLTRFSSQRIP